MPLLAELSILRRSSENTHVGSKGLPLHFSSLKYTIAGVKPTKWTRRDGRDATYHPIQLPVRTGTVRSVTSQFPTCLLRQRQRRAPLPAVLVLIRDRPAGHLPVQSPFLCGTLVCCHAHTGMGMNPITGSESYATTIRWKLLTLIRPSMHVCGVDVQQWRPSRRFELQSWYRTVA